MLWNKGTAQAQANHVHGLPGSPSVLPIDPNQGANQARLLQANMRVQQAMEEWLATSRLVQRPRPLPPIHDVDAFIDGLGWVNGILLTSFERILAAVQANQLTPEKALEQADAWIRWGLGQFLPDAQAQERRWTQTQYATVGPLVQIARYVGIATHLSEDLWNLRYPKVQPQGASLIPPSTAA